MGCLVESRRRGMLLCLGSARRHRDHLYGARMMPGVRVSTRNAMGRGTRRHSTVIISACLIFMGFECGSGEENCYGFKNSIVTFSLVEEFHEDSPYQNESAPWPHGIKDAAREA